MHPTTNKKPEIDKDENLDLINNLDLFERVDEVVHFRHLKQVSDTLECDGWPAAISLLQSIHGAGNKGPSFSKN